MERVRAVNADPDYLETITGVIVLGSFLSASQELGDVDVGIQLERKPTKPGSARQIMFQLLDELDRVNIFLSVKLRVAILAKQMGDELFMQLAEARRRLAQERGRRFGNLTEWVTWPSREIWLFLKSRTRQLSIHDFRELERLPPFRCKILFGERRALVKSLPNAQFVK